jgi:hypothetical protein
MPRSPSLTNGKEWAKKEKLTANAKCHHFVIFTAAA